VALKAEGLGHREKELANRDDRKKGIARRSPLRDNERETENPDTRIHSATKIRKVRKE